MSFDAISERTVAFLRRNNYWSEEPIADYIPIVDKLGLRVDSAARTFYLHMPAATIPGRLFELLSVCWFTLHGDYLQGLAHSRETLKLAEAYIPLDGFEGDGGFFYNRDTDEVLELELGEKLVAFWRGELRPQFASFAAFLEWYFELA